MPTKAVAAETMQVGKKGKGKHWTKAQIDARQAAADQIKRESPSKLMPPEWLSADALAIWKRKLVEVEGLKSSEALLDDLDAEMLAVYCDAYVQYQNAARIKRKSTDDVKELQAWSRIISSYADKLGFTPSARARLVKKIADNKNTDPFGANFD